MFSRVARPVRSRALPALHHRHLPQHAPRSFSTIRDVDTEEEFNQIINQNPLVIVDWKADWCGPCKQMKPHLQGLATKYKDTPVIAVDVDENGELATQYKVSALPTIHVFKDAQPYKSIIGANEKKLKEVVEEAHKSK